MRLSFQMNCLPLSCINMPVGDFMVRIGETIDNTYVIEENIGSGAGGIVYKAYHLRLKKNVVIKQIRQELRGKVNERGEVDILKNLKHMYIPQVYDFIEHEGDVYTVMEYISGLSLSDELKKRKRFPQKRVIKWAIQLCEALSYLHSRAIPIIHSDIKPANIMLSADDNICLIDFNISLLFTDDISAVGFTEGYSPPEQTSVFNIIDRMSMSKELKSNIDTETCFMELNSGKVNNNPKKIKSLIDARSDIYSLGASLYHLISGERPENSSSDITELDSYKIKIGHSLKQIINKAMNKNIEYRYATADEMLFDLNNINKYDYLYEKKLKRKRRIFIFTFIIIAIVFAAKICNILIQ